MSQSVIARDAELQKRVIQELGWDSRINAPEIGVVVEEGQVRLTGTVATYAEKMAAQEAAHRVTGVLDVANDIQVKPPGSHLRTDLDIAKAVRWELEWNVMVPHERIRSTVSDGWITLEGEVNLWRERIDAESAIRYLPGVKGLTNRIIVIDQGVDPAQIRGSIEQALERRAAREARRLNIAVKNGTVFVSGIVHTWAEKQAILGTVGHARGVSAVEDQLEIDPYA